MRIATRIVAFSLLCSGTAAATEMFKCRTRDGAIAYQTRACSDENAVLGSLSLAAEPPANPAAQAQRKQEQSRFDAWDRASRERLAPSLGGRAKAGKVSAAGSSSRNPPDPRVADCERARRERDLAYRRDGNKMNFDRRRQLQDAVILNCGLR